MYHASLPLKYNVDQSRESSKYFYLNSVFSLV